MNDDKLALEEARRAAQHETVKAQVEGEVQAEISERAAQKTVPNEAQRIDNVAGQFKSKAVDEVIDTEHEVQRARGLARISQVVDYIFFLIYGLLLIRLLLALFAARSDNGFVQFIRGISDLFYAPFRGIVASPTTPEGYTLALPIVIALVVYLLLHLAVNGLLRMFVHRKTEV